MQINVLIIDRSNPDDKVSYIPEGTAAAAKYGVTGERTLLQDIQDTIRVHGSASGRRRDIALVNYKGDDYCEHCYRGKSGQYIVEPTRNGPRGDGWKYLSEEQKQQCWAINNRLLEAIKRHPEMECLLAE